MRAILAAPLLAAGLLFSGAAGAAEPPTAQPTPVAPAGQVQFDMASKAAGRTYRVFVQRPSGAAPAKGWPVLVVTDGNGIFPSAASAERIYELAGKAALIVGVGYPTGDVAQSMTPRTRDLTPPTDLAHIRAVPGQPAPKLADYGGEEAFYHFLIDELRPRIAAAYPVDAGAQTLYGHSLGGLFVLGVLFSHPQAFAGYVASSPSIWWDERSVLKGEAAFARQVEAKTVAPRVLVMVGGREQDAPAGPFPPGITPEYVAKATLDARMVDNARELGARLSGLKGAPGYVAAVHPLADEDHISAIPASVARAVAFAEGAAP